MRSGPNSASAVHSILSTGESLLGCRLKHDHLLAMVANDVLPSYLLRLHLWSAVTSFEERFQTVPK